MQCADPYLVRSTHEWVRCGKCNFCLQHKRGEWSFRLLQEMKVAHTAAFITLTYDESTVSHEITSREPTLVKSHFQDFMKRARYHQYKTKTKDQIVYYGVGEYGTETKRPHYHAIVFNLHNDVLGKLSDVWGKGIVHIGDVEPASIAYVTGYVITKRQHSAKTLTPFALMSKANGGIGSSYLTPEMVRYHKRNRVNYATLYGAKVPLPRIYKDRIFSKLQKRVMFERDVVRLDKEYAEKIERLRPFYSDPYLYHQMQVSQAYGRVKASKGKF